MALSSSTYYSNSIQGNPQAGADVGVLDAHATPKYPAGYKVSNADGRVFRYCHVGTATNAGVLVGPTTASGGATYNAVTVVAPASAVVVQSEYPILPGQVGSHFIEVTVAAIAANKYQGGYLVTTRGTGVGDTYRIIGNTATDTPATGNVRIQLAEAIKVAFVASTGTIIVPSLYTDLTVSATSASRVTGVLMSTTTATNLWAWVCTRGVVGCEEDGTVTPVAGHQVTVSRAVAGAYATIVGGTSTVGAAAFSVPIIGHIITVSGATGNANRQGVINLELD